MARKISSCYARHMERKETFLKSFISNHRSYPVKNVSWEFWKPRREVQVTEEGFILWWKRVGAELALGTGDAQNCRTSTDCSRELSKDDQTRSSKTTGVVGKPELWQAQKRTPSYTCLSAGLLPLTLGRSGFVSMRTVCRGAQRERHMIDKRSGQM